MVLLIFQPHTCLALGVPPSAALATSLSLRTSQPPLQATRPLPMALATAGVTFHSRRWLVKIREFHYFLTHS